MVQMAKLIFYLLRELIFDNKEEYNYKSVKFNTRKFIVLILVCLSLTCNVWLGYRFLGVATALIHLRQQVEKGCQTHLEDLDKLPSRLAFTWRPHWIPASTKGLL